MRFAKLWPPILEAHHIAKVELARLTWALGKSGEIGITNTKPRQGTTHDEHMLSAGVPRTPA